MRDSVKGKAPSQKNLRNLYIPEYPAFEAIAGRQGKKKDGRAVTVGGAIRGALRAFLRLSDEKQDKLLKSENLKGEKIVSQKA